MSSGGGNRSDSVDLLESDSLGQDGRRRLSGGGLSESKSRQSGDGEHGELHLDSSRFGVFLLMFWCDLRTGYLSVAKRWVKVKRKYSGRIKQDDGYPW